MSTTGINSRKPLAKTDEPETKGEAFGSQRVISPRAERSCAPDVCSTTNSVQCRENIQLSEASKI